MADIFQLAEALHGERWQAPLARNLGVNLRTVQRWAAGQNEPSATVVEQLRQMLAAKIERDRALLQSP